MLHKISNIQSYKQKLFRELNTISANSFNEYALQLFHFQAEQTLIYKKYLQYLGIKPAQVQNIQQIPFLPIELFKYHKILRENTQESIIFESSGTTSQTIKSKHFVSDLHFYQQISLQLFQQKYGKIENFHIFALLPSYLERQNSSLVFMLEHFIKESKSEFSGFYLNNIEDMLEKIATAKVKKDRKILVWGVTFALLDLAEKNNGSELFNFENIILMETGGMKGRREELTREEVHQILTKNLNVSQVHSEYGMTELLSQAYSLGSGIFEPSPTMKISLRQTSDPLSAAKKGKSGGVNVIDLVNTESCAFIATQDIGQTFENQTFAILGRLDNSDLRGCNLMYEY
jgi:hypothetical protein